MPTRVVEMLKIGFQAYLAISSIAIATHTSRRNIA